MARLLANQIELPLKRIARQSFRGGDHELLNVRFARFGARPNVGLVALRGHLSPANQLLPLGCNELFDDLFTLRSLSLDAREKYNSRGELARFRQLGPKFVLDDPAKKLVRQRGENPGAVARVRLATAGPAMIHVAKYFFRIDQNLMAALPFNVRNETDAARIVLVRRIVKPLFRR